MRPQLKASHFFHLSEVFLSVLLSGTLDESCISKGLLAFSILFILVRTVTRSWLTGTLNGAKNTISSNSEDAGDRIFLWVMSV